MTTVLCETCANRIFPENGTDVGKNGTQVKCEEWHWINPTTKCPHYRTIGE